MSNNEAWLFIVWHWVQHQELAQRALLGEGAHVCDTTKSAEVRIKSLNDYVGIARENFDALGTMPTAELEPKLIRFRNKVIILIKESMDLAQLLTEVVEIEATCLDHQEKLASSFLAQVVTFMFSNIQKNAQQNRQRRVALRSRYEKRSAAFCKKMVAAILNYDLVASELTKKHHIQPVPSLDTLFKMKRPHLS